jgi:hypothetical protein
MVALISAIHAYTAHLNYFLLLAGISADGVVVVLILISLLKNAPEQPGPSKTS